MLGMMWEEVVFRTDWKVMESCWMWSGPTMVTSYNSGIYHESLDIHCRLGRCEERRWIEDGLAGCEILLPTSSV